MWFEVTITYEYEIDPEPYTAQNLTPDEIAEIELERFRRGLNDLLAYIPSEEDLIDSDSVRIKPILDD